MASVRYRFGHFELQPDERRLLAHGQALHLGPHAFDLLVALVGQSGHLVTKDELLDRVWGKVVVEDNTLQAHISALRKMLGAKAITTVSGRGYRFTEDVTPIRATAGSATEPKHNLPHALTSFIGREREIAQLTQLLGGTRLLTLTGAGGCGKTRLAIQLAKQHAHAYADGAWIAELAALTDAALLPQSVASVLGIKEKVGERLIDTLAQSLAPRSVLLVLDNAEHLIEACAELAESLLRRCARLVILATSREPLGITGELTYRIPSLSVPEESDAMPESIAAFESARLFIDRAQLQSPYFVVTAQNSGAVASICRRLDGIALALELAAARVRSMSVEQLSRRLDRRFDVLTEGSRTALPRHRTLRSLIDWSYELLSEREKAILRRVSVFSGGWTLEGAQRVCGEGGADASDVFDLLASLADKNLIHVETHDNAARYSQLETVRHYARDRLRDSNEEAAAQRAHLAHSVTLAETAEPNLGGAEQATWLDRLEMERDNLRSALSFAASCGDPRGLRLAAAVWRFWLIRGYFSEGRGLLEEQLARSTDSSELGVRGKALHGTAVLSTRMGDAATAQRLGEESLDIRRRTGDRPGMAATLGGLGNVLFHLRQYEASRARHEESLAIYRELGIREGTASELNNLGLAVAAMKDFEGARRLYEEALVLRREMGDRWGLAASLLNLADIQYEVGALESAREMCDLGEKAYREVGDQQGLARALRHHAFVVCDQGDSDGAFALAKTSLATVGDSVNTCEALFVLGYAISKNQPREASTVWGAVERSREELELMFSPYVRERHERVVARAREAMGDNAAFDLAWCEGRAMTLDRALDFALSIGRAGATGSQKEVGSR
jgi:predicted ATPase/DNA-binding winged helix-turn-helix (wHTH) protein